MYAPLQEEYEAHNAEEAGGDRWCDKERMSGLWGKGGQLERTLEEEERKTLFVVGINADQVRTALLLHARGMLTFVGCDGSAYPAPSSTPSPSGTTS
jgi:hypothetical protein